MISSRASDLDRVLRLLAETHRAWTDSEEPGLLPNTDYWTAIQATIAAFKFGDIPQAYRDIERSVARLEVLWDEFAREQSVSPNPTRVPGRDFFAELGMVMRVREQAAAPTQYPALPGLRHMLSTDRLTAAQIARVLDWTNERGEDDVARVTHEIALGEKSEYWDLAPDPRNARVEQRRESWRNAVDRLEHRLDAKLNPPRKAAPESLADLVNQGLAISQIARIFDTTPESVVEEVMAEGLPMPPAEPEAILAPTDTPPRTDSQAAPLDHLPIAERILLYAEEHPGVSTDQIAQAVGATPAKVKAALRTVAK